MNRSKRKIRRRKVESTPAWRSIVLFGCVGIYLMLMVYLVGRLYHRGNGPSQMAPHIEIRHHFARQNENEQPPDSITGLEMDVNAINHESALQRQEVRGTGGGSNLNASPNFEAKFKQRPATNQNNIEVNRRIHDGHHVRDNVAERRSMALREHAGPGHRQPLGGRHGNQDTTKVWDRSLLGKWVPFHQKKKAPNGEEAQADHDKKDTKNGDQQQEEEVLRPKYEFDEKQIRSQHNFPAFPEKGSLLFNTSVRSDPDVLTKIMAHIHIPKCSGHDFKEKLCKVAKNDFRHFPGCADFSHSPGCGPPEWSPTHCGYDEVDDCLRRGMARDLTKGNRLGAPFPAVQPHQRPLFATVLRDPVERVISEFYWWKGTAPHKNCTRHPQWGKELCQAAQKGIEAWVRSPYNIAHNRQARYFAAKNDIAPGNKSYHIVTQKEEPQWECTTFHASYTNHYWSKEYGTNAGGWGSRLNRDEAVADHVIKVLEERFWFVGLLEDYPTNVPLFSHLVDALVGGQHPKKLRTSLLKNGQVKKTNSARKQPVSDELKAEIRDRNRLDDKIFKYIVLRFYDAASKVIPGYSLESKNDQNSGVKQQ